MDNGDFQFTSIGLQISARLKQSLKLIDIVSDASHTLLEYG